MNVCVLQTSQVKLDLFSRSLEATFRSSKTSFCWNRIETVCAELYMFPAFHSRTGISLKVVRKRVSKFLYSCILLSWIVMPSWIICNLFSRFNVWFIHIKVFEQGCMYIFCSLGLMFRIHVYYIFVLVFVQRSWTRATWKNAIEIKSLSLSAWYFKLRCSLLDSWPPLSFLRQHARDRQKYSAFSPWFDFLGKNRIGYATGEDAIG